MFSQSLTNVENCYFNFISLLTRVVPSMFIMIIDVILHIRSFRSISNFSFFDSSTSPLLKLVCSTIKIWVNLLLVYSSTLIC